MCPLFEAGGEMGEGNKLEGNNRPSEQYCEPLAIDRRLAGVPVVFKSFSRLHRSMPDHDQLQSAFYRDHDDRPPG